MKIAIAHLGTPTQSIPSTSILKKLSSKEYGPEITWISKSEYSYIFKYNRYIDKSISLNNFLNNSEQYDVLLNLFPLKPIANNDAKAKEKIGFGYNDNFKDIEPYLLKTSSNQNLNIFQLYYKIMGWTWHGEGFNLCYYPKTKQKAGRIGVSIANINLKDYVLDNLQLDNTRLWYIPMKKNIFKKMDEINKCKKVITDDLLTAHLAIYLRKYVYFLETYPLPLKLELFNSGEIYKVQLNNI